MNEVKVFGVNVNGIDYYGEASLVNNGKVLIHRLLIHSYDSNYKEKYKEIWCQGLHTKSMGKEHMIKLYKAIRDQLQPDLGYEDPAFY